MTASGMLTERIGGCIIRSMWHWARCPALGQWAFSAIVASVVAAIGPQSAQAGYVGVMVKGTSGCCTIHGTRSSVHTNSWSTQCGDFVNVRVVVTSSDLSKDAQTGQGSNCNDPYSSCGDTAGILKTFYEWTGTSGGGCKFLAGSVSVPSTHIYKVIRHCDSCNNTWNLYVDSVLEKQSGTIFGDPATVRAGGISDALGSTAHTDFGTTTTWDRTAQADDQTPKWTTITQNDTTVEQGDWTVGTLPDPFYVNDN